MNSRKTRNTFLALTGLAALFVCILACTSFSPDDKKILYPTFDPKTRSMGVAVYDRPSRESRVLFTCKTMLKQGREARLVMMRSQWLADGKNVVITWMPLSDSKEDESVTTFAMLPLEGKEPVRLLHWAGFKEASDFTFYPLPVVGTRLFWNTESNTITLDLLTGETQVRTNIHPLLLFASLVPGRFGFVEQLSDERIECGMLNPETMTREWRVQIENNKSVGGAFRAFSPVGKKVVFSPEEGGEPVLQLYEEGQSPKLVPVPAAKTEHLELGQVEFSPDGRSLVVAFQSEVEGKTGHSFGIIELPLDGRSPKRTVLISEAKIKIEKYQSLAFFQFGLSHDGKALAVSSAYLAAASENFRAEDCALFIVDLASAKRPVTRIPIPLPAGGGVLIE